MPDGGVHFSDVPLFLKARVAAGIFVHRQCLVSCGFHLLLFVLRNKSKKVFLKTYCAL